MQHFVTCDLITYGIIYCISRNVTHIVSPTHSPSLPPTLLSSSHSPLFLPLSSLPPPPLPLSLEMLDKTEVPGITEGYPLVVAMNALLDAIKSVSLVVNDNVTQTTLTLPPDVVLQSLHNPGTFAPPPTSCTALV